MYSRFIQNRPCGTDKMESKSQERLAEAIKKHMEQNDQCQTNEATKGQVLPRIIGIEGEWGSGKSNVVKLLKDKMEEGNKYYFFEYDAWGNQEDLPRRSLCELLTKQLVEKKLLSGKTKITFRGGETQIMTWEERLKYLLAQKTETNTDKHPRLSIGFVGLIAVVFASYLATAITDAIETEISSLRIAIFKVGIPVLVGLSFCIVAFIKHKKNWINSLLTIFSKEVTSYQTYETVSAAEPATWEFRQWMTDISNHLKKNGKPRFVIVIDNMDRLPAEKVRSLWSSIHIIFAEEGFEYIWVIIPFDFIHLRNAFAEEQSDNDGDIDLATHFVQKTFPIVYRVPPPVITDYRELFAKLFIEAFGEDNDDLETISRIYRRKKSIPNIREIITFINSLVALHQEHEGDNISLVNMAIFTLCKRDILKEKVTEDKILSGDYLRGIEDIISNTEELQQDISSIVYGIDGELAKQVPLTNYLRKCFKEEDDYDINKYSDNESFDIILDEYIKSAEHEKSATVIKVLAKLERTSLMVDNIWIRVAEQHIDKPLSDSSLEEEYKPLLAHVKDRSVQSDIISAFYHNLRSIEKLNGGDYFGNLDDLQKFLDSRKIDIKIPDNDDMVFPVNDFIYYLRRAGKDHKKYKVTTDTVAFVKALNETIETDKFNYSDIVKLLYDNKDDQFDLSSLPNSIEEKIGSNGITASNIGELFETYGILNDHRPLDRKMSSQQISNIWKEVSSKERNLAFYHAAAMMFTFSDVGSIELSGDEYNKIAKLIPLYTTHGKMLLRTTHSSECLNKIVAIMVKEQIGNDCNLVDILPKYYDIKNKIQCTDTDFLKDLAHFADAEKQQLYAADVTTLIPNTDFYQLIIHEKTSLTPILIDLALNTLKNPSATAPQSSNPSTAVNRSNNQVAAAKLPPDSSANTLYTKRNDNNYYWNKVIDIFLENKILQQPIGKNLIELCRKTLGGMAKGEINPQTMPKHLETLLDIAGVQQFSDVIQDIRNDFCNGKNLMQPNKFKLLECYLREVGNLVKHEDALNKILKPVVSAPDCLNIILDNEKYYIKFINKYPDDSALLKEELNNLYEKSNDEKLGKFIKAISS